MCKSNTTYERDFGSLTRIIRTADSVNALLTGQNSVLLIGYRYLQYFVEILRSITIFRGLIFRMRYRVLLFHSLFLFVLPISPMPRTKNVQRNARIEFFANSLLFKLKLKIEIIILRFLVILKKKNRNSLLKHKKLILIILLTHLVLTY